MPAKAFTKLNSSGLRTITPNLKVYLKHFDEHLATDSEESRRGMTEMLYAEADRWGVTLEREGMPLSGMDAIENVLDGPFRPDPRKKSNA